MRCSPQLKARLVAAVLLPCALWPTGLPPARAQDASIEYAVKATYLYKFVPFVQWPPSAFASPQSPVVLCIVGSGAFGEIVSRAVGGQRMEGRPMTSRVLAAADASSGCHVLYTVGSAVQPVADGLAALRGKPVLTVTDAPAAGGPKGVVNFVLVDNRVRFEIDLQAAAENGLAISSKLLSLAVAVKGGR